MDRSLNDLYIRRFYTTMRWKRAKSLYLCCSYLGTTHSSSRRICKYPTERISSVGCCRRSTPLERINRWNHCRPVYVTYEVEEHLNFHNFTTPSDKCIMFCSINGHNCPPISLVLKRQIRHFLSFCPCSICDFLTNNHWS